MTLPFRDQIDVAAFVALRSTATIGCKKLKLFRLPAPKSDILAGFAYNLRLVWAVGPGRF